MNKRKIVRNLIVIITFIVSISILSGCSVKKTEVEKTNNKKEADTLEIGLSLDSYIIERWERDRDVFVSTAKELGAEINVQSANGDIDVQISQIEYFIEKNVDVIVVVAIDADKLSSVIKQAKDAGIKVIAYDRLIRNADVDMYISFDNEKVGTMMGEEIASHYSNKKVIMICGAPADNNVSLVNGGFETIMANRGIEIIDKTFCEGWKAELAAEYVNKHIDLIANADAIMCGNDDIATNVIRTLAVYRKAGAIDIVGQDADLAACQHIVEGTQNMTVYKPVEKLAKEAAKYAVDFANKKEVDVNTTINDGTYDVPYVALEPISVYKGNIDEIIIDSGFHSRDDVYLNISE
ncbi:MAG: substrate-binding domain-containing protein [Lachnospiraceae bacterium]|nr:substrate-binding domain-containing protein [Lachnospiraceae bacterium]